MEKINTDYKLEKISLNCSRCGNRDVGSLIHWCRFQGVFWRDPARIFLLLFTAVPNTKNNNEDQDEAAYNTSYNGSCHVFVFLFCWVCCAGIKLSFGLKLIVMRIK